MQEPCLVEGVRVCRGPQRKPCARSRCGVPPLSAQQAYTPPHPLLQAKAKAEAEAKAFKENMLNMPKVAAKKAKDPILLQLAKDDLVLAVSRLTLYAVNAKVWLH